jgi:signal peptidase I
MKKSWWNKFWQIVWKDDSFKGWIISILFVLIVVKFIFFPLLNLATGTALPLAIVESCSMHHQGTLFSDHSDWWERHDSKYTNLDITEKEFKSFNFKRGFTKGDILFITGTKPEKIKMGDVIIFNAGANHPIIHRVTNIKQENNEFIFSTFGDNNLGQLNSELEIKSEQIVGKARFRIIPYVGWIKLSFFEKMQPENNKGICHEN